MVWWLAPSPHHKFGAWITILLWPPDSEQFYLLIAHLSKIVMKLSLNPSQAIDGYFNNSNPLPLILSNPVFRWQLRNDFVKCHSLRNLKVQTRTRLESFYLVTNATANKYGVQ